MITVSDINDAYYVNDQDINLVIGTDHVPYDHALHADVLAGWIANENSVKDALLIVDAYSVSGDSSAQVAIVIDLRTHAQREDLATADYGASDNAQFYNHAHVSNPQQAAALALWMANGGVVAPLVPPPTPVPVQVTSFQAKTALHFYGLQIGRPTLEEEVNALVAGLPGSLPSGFPALTDNQVFMIKRAWANALHFRRDSPALALIFPALGLTMPEQLDALFVIAAGIAA